MEIFWNDLNWVLPYRSDAATVVMRAFTWMGYSTFYMLFLPLGYWLWHRPAFTRLAVMVAVSGVLNAFLKDYWQVPRPDVALSLDGKAAESFAMPSGHAQTSSVLWVWLALEVRRGWMWAVAALLIAGIVASRLYLGVHHVADIAAGLAIGLALVGAGRVGLHFAPMSYTALALVLLAAQAVVFTMWPVVQGAPAMPGAATGLGAFAVAWLIGAEAARRAGYPADGPHMPRGWRAPAAALAGIAGLLALYVGFRKMAGALDPDGHVAMYFASALIALYMTWGALWLFRRMGLAGAHAALHGDSTK